MMKKFVLALLAGSVAPVGVAQAAVINLSATNFALSAVTQTFDPGSYVVSLVAGTYTAWAPAIPAQGNWTDYYKYTINGVDSYFNPLNSQRYSTAQDAFNAYSSQPQLQLNFATRTNVTFAIADGADSFGDNAGGVSLNIATVPETATWAMMVVGFGAVGAAMRGRRRVRAAFA